MKTQNENHVLIVVITTSGIWPADGYDKTPVHQKVKVILKQAANKLGIVSTDNWVAKVGVREIDPELTFEQNNLSGTVSIDYGPRESGGGKV